MARPGKVVKTKKRQQENEEVRSRKRKEGIPLHPLSRHLIGVEYKHHPHGMTLDEEERLEDGDQ